VKPEPASEGSVVIESPERVLVKAGGKDQQLDAGECSCMAGAPSGSADRSSPNNAAGQGMSSKKKAIIITSVVAGGATAAAIGVTKAKDKSKKDKD
jgi:hypothetical protein